MHMKPQAQHYRRKEGTFFGTRFASEAFEDLLGGTSSSPLDELSSLYGDVSESSVSNDSASDAELWTPRSQTTCNSVYWKNPFGPH
jgi:hypothetical protein